MDVVLLEGVVHHLEVLLRPRIHHALERLDEAARSEVPHPAVHAPRDVNGKAWLQLRASQMRHALITRAVLAWPASPRTLAAPTNLRLGPTGVLGGELRVLGLRPF